MTQEDDVEIHALARRGWSMSAIARHTGRDRKTIRKYLAGNGPVGEPQPSCLEPYRAYLEARFDDDPHIRASVLFGELVPLRFDRSYPTLVREIRELALRPACDCCKAGGLKGHRRARSRAGRGAAARLARAHGDAVGREGLFAGRRAVALGPGPRRVR